MSTHNPQPIYRDEKHVHNKDLGFKPEPDTTYRRDYTGTIYPYPKSISKDEARAFPIPDDFWKLRPTYRGTKPKTGAKWKSLPKAVHVIFDSVPTFNEFDAACRVELLKDVENHNWLGSEGTYSVWDDDALRDYYTFFLKQLYRRGVKFDKKIVKHLRLQDYEKLVFQDVDILPTEKMNFPIMWHPDTVYSELVYNEVKVFPSLILGHGSRRRLLLNWSLMKGRLGISEDSCKPKSVEDFDAFYKEVSADSVRVGVVDLTDEQRVRLASVLHDSFGLDVKVEDVGESHVGLVTAPFENYSIEDVLGVFERVSPVVSQRRGKSVDVRMREDSRGVVFADMVDDASDWDDVVGPTQQELFDIDNES